MKMIKSLLLFLCKTIGLPLCMLIIMIVPTWACGDEWETRTEEMQAQFDQSIEAECALKHITCRELDDGR